jgi:ADP-ribose pyrophosphatase
MPPKIVAETRYLRLLDHDGWFYVERPNASAVVTLIPLTRDRKLLFVEQYRRPLSRNVLEFPAGLVGDESGRQEENILEAAARELEEETGYRAMHLEVAACCASSPGMAKELVHLVLAWDLDRVGPGGGVENENIKVHEVPLTDVRRFLKQREQEGMLIAAKVYACLYFAQERWG